MKPPTTLELVWEHDLVLRGRSGDASIVLDSAGQAGGSRVVLAQASMAGAAALGSSAIQPLSSPRAGLRAAVSAVRARS